jgi:hypothetical protein
MINKHNKDNQHIASPDKHTTVFYQYSVEVANIVSLALFTFFFLQVSAYDQTKISNNLEDYMYFRVTSSILIGYVYLMYILYFTQFRKAKPYSMGAGILLVLESYGGWVLLISIYTDPWHMVGFSMFVAGIVAYWIIVIVLHRLEFFSMREQYMLLFATFAMGVTYIVTYFTCDPISWTFEYIAMLLWHACNILFFIYHDPNPNLVIDTPSHEKYIQIPIPII